MTNYWDDDEREEGVLTKVSGPHTFSDAPEGTAPYYDVTSSNGWSCCVSAEYGIVPKVGDAFVTWGSIGRPMRGQAINGRVLYYRTSAEQDLEDQKQVEAHKAKRIAEYESKRADFDRRVAALPDPLRERVEAFRAFKGDEWRWEFETYELFCCEEAVKIAATFNTGDAIKKFSKMDHGQQKKAFPQMDKGHSGNTFGMSVRLAYHLAENPEQLVQEHGALCPLVGCKDYGCYSVRHGGEVAA